MEEGKWLFLKMAWQFAFDSFVADFQANLDENGLHYAIEQHQELVNRHEQQFKLRSRDDVSEKVAKALWRSAYHMMWAAILSGVWHD